MAPLTQISVEIIKIVHAVIAEEVIKSCYKYFTSRLSDEGLTLEKNQEYFTKALENNLTRTVNWAKYILFYDLVIDKYTATKYIELDFYLRPLRETGAKVEHKEDLLNEVFNLTDKHIVILGEGGSGKTTSMQMLCSKLLTDEKYLSNSFPLVIRFRDHSNEIRNLNSRQSKKVHYILHTILYHELGLPVKKGDKASEEEFDYLEGAFIKPYIANVLNYLSPLVILDGFDEVEQSARQMILSEIKELCLSCTSARIVVTSRIGDFDYSLPNARKFQIAPFDDKKIIKFCCKWLEDEVRGMKLYDAIKSTPYYDTTMRPINLTMLASLYEANGELPADPKSIYERVIDLHLFRWDKERDVRRGMKIKSFDTRLMRQFIEHLAFHLATENYFTFDKFELKLIYVNKLLPAFAEVLTEELFESTINEVEVHS
ncbi:MAG: NACHT domain-containing protein, partial [Flavobacteriales bacterium]|nr:NACHT domain-containing protein [Flavobacteriales bacterium]